jgi:hypothetical protein
VVESVVREIRVHYRKAILAGIDQPEFTLQERLTRLVNGELGKDARERVIVISDDNQHRGCLNFSKVGKDSFLADIMHLDGRSSLPTWIHPTEPKPVAEIVPREVAKGEASLGEPVYLLIVGNHVAAIERLGFRTTNLANYINGLLAKAGELEDKAHWKLVPKVEIQGAVTKGGAVKKIIVRPYAVVAGEGPSQAPAEDRGRRKLTRAASRFEGLMVHGYRVIEMLKAAGADEAKLETLREGMSSDLILKAKLELTVQSLKLKSKAEIDSNTVHQALADLAIDGTVNIVDENGNNDGKLVQLVHKAEVMETGGLIDWQRASQALLSAMSTWAAKGAIELKQ